MKKQPVVILLGDSMLMEGVAVSLACNEALRTQRLDPAAADLHARLGSIAPDLIAFELGTEWSHAILSLLQEQPGSLLLGLDLNCSRVIVMNSHQHLTKSMQELYQLFQDEVITSTRT